MRVINTTKHNPAVLDTMGRLAFYSGMDNLTLFEIHNGLDELMDAATDTTYRFEMELQAALLEMSFNGIHVDQQERHRLQKEYNATVENLTKLLNDMLEAVGYFSYYTRMTVHEFSVVSGIALDTLPVSWEEWKERPIQWRRWVKQVSGAAPLKNYHKGLKEFTEFNPNSPAQKLRLFYHFFGHPDNEVAEPYFYKPPWLKTYGVKEYKTRKSNGEYGPSTDREALERIIKASYNGEKYAAYWAAPFAQVCLDIADLVKSLGFLNCKLEDGVFRASFGTVTETGRLASRKNAMGFGSNAQNVTPKLRKIFKAPHGWKLAAPDYSQIESRIVAAICYRLFGAINYLAATECGDAHTLAASMVWDKLPWPADFNIKWTTAHGPFPADMLKAAKKIAGNSFYRHFSYRDAVKRLGHGSNYLGRPPQMAKQTHIPQKLVEHFQQAYFEALPEIPQWHDWVADQIQLEGTLTTMLGRVRRFFGRPTDDATLREAVAHEPQSVGADYTNRALLRILKAHLFGVDAVREYLDEAALEIFESNFPDSLPVELFLQKHDEIGFRFHEPHEELVMPIIQPLMEEHIVITSPEGKSRDWYVPIEAESGWNLGTRYSYPDGVRTDSNPNGLDHVDPARKRVAADHWSTWKL